MRVLFAIAFLCIVIAILLLCNINSDAIRDAMQKRQKRNISLKKEAEKKRENKILTAFHNIVIALETMNQIGSLYYIMLISFLLIIFGAFTGITFGNPYLAVVFAIILASVPFIYVRMQYIDYKALVIDEMEIALSVITSSIERTENIVLSVEENLNDIKKPLNSIFSRFLYAVNHNVPIENAIEDMKKRVNNKIFYDWCDNLKRVSKDRTLKHSLRPIVNRITDIKIVSAEAKNILREASSEFMGVTLFSLVFMVINYIILPYVFKLVGTSGVSPTFIGIVSAIDILMLFLFSVRAFTLTKDIDFENAKGADLR